MTVTFALRERGKRPSWRMSDYFVDRSMIIEVSIGKEQAMSGAVCLLAHSWEQIGSRFFPNVSKDTVNRRLRKLVDIDLIKKTTAYVGRRAISGYSLTQGGLAKITPTLPRYLLEAQKNLRRCSERESERYKKPYERSEWRMKGYAFGFLLHLAEDWAKDLLVILESCRDISSGKGQDLLKLG